MAGPWLYSIAEGKGYFYIEGGPVRVEFESYRELVKNGRLVEDKWWRISQHWLRITRGHEIFIYMGALGRGIIGYAIIKSVEEKQNRGWCVELEFDLDKCQRLIDQPVPANVIRGWKLNLRRNPVDLSEVAADLYSQLPWVV